MSDTYGRKPMYMLSLSIGIIASIICVFSPNIATLIVFRAIQSCGASSGQTLGAGVIADVVPLAQRGKAYGIFSIGPLFGQAIGPTVGDVLSQYLGWQSTFFFLAILNAALLLMVTVLLPETLRKKRDEGEVLEVVPGEDEDQEKKTVVVKKQVYFKALKNLGAAFKPMGMMLRDPTVIMTTIYNSVIFSCLFMAAQLLYIWN